VRGHQHQEHDERGHRSKNWRKMDDSVGSKKFAAAFRHWPVALEAALAVRRAQAAKDIAEDYGVKSNLFFLGSP